MKICLDLGVFDILAKSNDGFQSEQSIAAQCGAETSLLARLLRHLSAMGALKEVQPHLYALTPFTDALRRKEMSGCLDFWFDIATPVFLHLPEFLASTQYRDPKDAAVCNWRGSKHTQLDFFAYMNENPRQLASFANCMSGYCSGDGVWTDLYPVKERLLDGFQASESDVLIVDVGGSLGHDMERFQLLFPESRKSRVVVQDTPTVIEEARKKQNADSAIQLMAHDFFEPQPIANARAYFLHSILHDWTDDKAVSILQNVKSAMKPGYSKVLINEVIVSNTDPSPLATGMDLIMMGAFSSRERTRVDWEALLEGVGLKLAGVWLDNSVALDGVIEAELM